jgi:hypothetical protein
MGWSLTAPTLPGGSEWVQKDTIYIPNNQVDVTGTISIARLEGTNFALKIVETRTFHLTNPNFTDFYKTYHRCDVAGVTGEVYTESRFGSSGSTKTYYFTGIAAAGASIKVVVGVKADSVTKEISFTAPALLGVPFVFNDNGTPRKVSKWMYNDNGTAKNVILKYHT